MNRREFLKKLKEALENDLSGSVVQENINYYDQYISDEVKNGKSEEEVIAMLGDPWMIARTVIDAAEMGIHQESYSQSSKQQYTKQDYTKEDAPQSGQDFVNSMFKPVSKWKKFAFFGGLILAVLLIISIISGLIRFLAPVIIPIILIVFVFKLLGNRR